ncbi:MAG TPA: ATP synthase F0 subunit A [Candidatus Marinimicrobia bacterium]|nr:ATP synthase F0 subunit A [Candidatus Neomarinimicrobiota bacterium]
MSRRYLIIFLAAFLIIGGGRANAAGDGYPEQVDFEVMKDHLIGRTVFEIFNPFHPFHPIMLYVPIWIVPETDKLSILKDGKEMQVEGKIIAHTSEYIEIDQLVEKYAHRTVVRKQYPVHQVTAVDDVKNIDISPYKQVIMMWLVSLLLILFLSRALRRKEPLYKSRIGNLIEIFVLYFRDEVIYPNMGKKQGRRFAPLILSLFFFILLANLFGLIPGSSTATGSISVTLGLATITFITTQLFGNKDYWRHKFATPGVPLWLLPIMIPVEILGLFTKPFALTIRLFANMTAGHVIILSFLGMIINFKNGWIALGAIPMAIAIYMLELFVGFLQAYIFALLSSIFIGEAVQEHEGHGH